MGSKDAALVVFQDKRIRSAWDEGKWMSKLDRGIQ